MIMSQICNSDFEVYRPTDGRFRAFFKTQNRPRPVTVVLPVSTMAAARQLAAVMYPVFVDTGSVSLRVSPRLKGYFLRQFLYDFIGDLWRVRRFKLATSTAYRLHLKGLFNACRWERFGDVTVESFLAWREQATCPRLQANLILRQANTFFDTLVVFRIVPSNPLRAVKPLCPSEVVSPQVRERPSVAQ
jgi:hypothetical protein